MPASLLPCTGVEEAEQESSEMMNEFVEYIKARKAVPLDTLALEFGLRTTDAIDRIHAMEEAGRLTGVMDDRGKVRSYVLYVPLLVASWKAV